MPSVIDDFESIAKRMRELGCQDLWPEKREAQSPPPAEEAPAQAAFIEDMFNWMYAAELFPPVDVHGEGING